MSTRVDYTDTLSAASWLAERGIYVFPVDHPELERCAGIGRGHDPGTCDERGKHPCVPFKAGASIDPQQLAAWFTGYPRNVGVACGLSGLVVVDEDTPGDFARYATSIGQSVPATFTVQTGRGHHLYFRAREGVDLGNVEGGLGSYGVNIRGQGGYVVGPGSLHAATGALYTVTSDVDPAPIPEWLVEALRGPVKPADGAFSWDAFDGPRGLAAVPDTIRGPSGTGPGDRHDVLVRYACSLRARDVPLPEAEQLFRLVWRRCEQPPVCKTPLPWDDARAKLDDCYQRYTPDHHRPDPVPEHVDDEQTSDVRERFPRLDLAALLAADRPPREWVLDGLIPAGASVALVAPAGTGKSLLLLGAVLAVARGDRQFAGLPLTSRRVLLVDMENTEDDLADRLAALGVTVADVADLDDLVVIHLPPLAPLDTALGGAEMAAILDTYDVQPGDVVVLDSLQRVINGPENDSDTLRAFYRHTAIMLKRRGVTVVRTDNAGKDVDKGARGTSGKRDDVDVELLLQADAEKPERLRLRPGKSRIPGIRSVVVNRDVDDDGRLTYTTAGDPFRLLVGDAHRVLDELAIPTDAGERKAAETIRDAGHKVVRAALRVAIKERRDTLNVRGIGAPKPYGAPSSENDEGNCAASTRRTLGAPDDKTTNPQASTRNRCAEPQRRTHGADDTDAHGGGAPPLSLYKERRTGAFTQNQAEPSRDPEPPDTVAASSGRSGTTGERPHWNEALNAAPDVGICRHGKPAGDQPDPFIKGKLRCTECRAEAATSNHQDGPLSSARVRGSARAVLGRTESECASAPIVRTSEPELDQAVELLRSHLGAELFSEAAPDAVAASSSRSDVDTRSSRLFDEKSDDRTCCPSCMSPLDEPPGDGCGWVEIHEQGVLS